MSDCTACNNGKRLSLGWKCDVCGRVSRSELAAPNRYACGEQRIKLAAKLYEARDAMRGLYREDYKAKIEEFQCFIRHAMKKHSVGALEATMGLVEGLQRHRQDSGMTQALLLAACVELIEPSKHND